MVSCCGVGVTWNGLLLWCWCYLEWSVVVVLGLLAVCRCRCLLLLRGTLFGQGTKDSSTFQARSGNPICEPSAVGETPVTSHAMPRHLCMHILLMQGILLWLEVATYTMHAYLYSPLTSPNKRITSPHVAYASLSISSSMCISLEIDDCTMLA
jgi:hypothetical protein